ncbi:MAG: hypothetical protein KTR26_01900 [Flammeovirgaceae bacterium]|nr:hypothetical protein [Flammeovirgaceae bacterium]
MTELSLHPKYVAPFYMDLMNLNFLNKSDEEIRFLFDSIKSISKELSDDKLIKMLNDSWRSSKVSAWVIGITRRENLVNEIISFLSKKGTYHSEHALVNLLILKGCESNQFIKKYITQQINFLLESDNKLIVENLSIEWAISVVGYNDKYCGTDDLNEVYISEEWLNFESELKMLAFYENIRPSFEPTYFENELTKLITKIKTNNSPM